jgi:hypothetical protein
MKLKHSIHNNHKICSKCGKNKHITEFYKDNRKWRKSNSIRSTCKQCDIIISREYAKKHPEFVAYRQRYCRLHHYGMTLMQFNELLKKQGNKCACCGTTTPGGTFNQWHVDHDHSCCSGKDSCGKCIRGLLCQACNRALGIIKDNPEHLLKLINYLKVWRETSANL